MAKYLPAKYAPLQADGNGLQSVYLTEISEAFAAALASVIGHEYLAAVRQLDPNDAETAAEDEAENVIRGRTCMISTPRALGVAAYKFRVCAN